MPIPRLTDTQYAAFRIVYRDGSNARAVNKRTLEALARADLIEHTALGWRPTNMACDLVAKGLIELD